MEEQSKNKSQAKPESINWTWLESERLNIMLEKIMIKQYINRIMNARQKQKKL